MKATSKNMLKLQELSKEKNKAKAQLSDFFWLQQHTLPQEVITAWGSFEMLELEAQMVEAEALKEIEGEIPEQRKFDVDTMKLVKLWRYRFFALVAIILASSIIQVMMIGDVSRYHYQPNDFNGCSGSEPFFMC